MEAHVGDHVVVEGAKVGMAPRRGEVLEILPGTQGDRLRVRLEVPDDTWIYAVSVIRRADYWKLGAWPQAKSGGGVRVLWPGGHKLTADQATMTTLLVIASSEGSGSAVMDAASPHYERRGDVVRFRFRETSVFRRDDGRGRRFRRGGRRRRAGLAPVPSVSSRSNDSGLTRRMPASGTSVTSRLWPGSKRTAVPAGMSRRMPRACSRSNCSAALVSRKW